MAQYLTLYNNLTVYGAKYNYNVNIVFAANPRTLNVEHVDELCIWQKWRDQAHGCHWNNSSRPDMKSGTQYYRKQNANVQKSADDTNAYLN